MGGVPQRASKLNKTLEHVVDILDENNYTDWFLAYGTLLGIVRNNSCIEHDDDIDIICNINERSRLIEILEKNNFKLFTDDDLNPGPKSFKDGIVKTFGTEEYVSIDFYFADVKDGSYFDRWEYVDWTNCYINEEKEFVKYKWNDRVLNLPNDAELKLERRYGKNWRTPLRKHAGGNGNRHVPL